MESIKQRDQQRTIRDKLALRLAEIEQTCPPDVAAQIEVREQELRNRLTLAERDMRRLAEPLTQADTAVASASTRLNDLRRQVQMSDTERLAQVIALEEEIPASPVGYCERHILR